MEIIVVSGDIIRGELRGRGVGNQQEDALEELCDHRSLSLRRMESQFLQEVALFGGSNT